MQMVSGAEAAARGFVITNVAAGDCPRAISSDLNGLGRFLRDLRRRCDAADGDPPGLHGFRDFTDQPDPEQTTVEGRVLHLNVVRQIELSLERPS